MAQEEVQLSRGSKATMPNNKVPGRILIATDTGEAYVDDTSTSRVQIQDTTKVSKSGDTMSGPLNLGNNKITNVATGSSDSDVANVGQMHQYVDNEITNNQYSGTNPINVDNDGHTISHAAIGTAGSVGPTANVSPAHGGTFQVPQITTDVTGHVSSKSSRTITLPAAPTSVATLTTTRRIDGVSFNGSADITHFGACSTAAGTAAKVVACNGFTKVMGARILVKFNITNTAASPTLNVNGTGASPIYFHGSIVPTNKLVANHTYEFVFTGTNFELVGDLDTTYTGGTAIAVSGTTITHEDTGQAGTAGPSGNGSPGYGGTISIPQISTNAQGHVTSIQNRTITLPTAQDIPDVETYEGEAPIKVTGTTISHNDIGTAGSVGPAGDSTATYGGKITIPQITVDAKGHVSAKDNRTITLPSAPTTISGNAGTATKLKNARTLDGVSFNGSANVTHYGTCSTAAATAVKDVSCTGFTKDTGARIVVKFTVTNTASSPKLNVNSTGASPIYYNGAAMPASVLGANKVYEFIFTGTKYELVGDRDTNTVYTAGTGISISSNTIGHSNSVSASNAGPSSTSTLSPGGKVSVPYVAYNAQGHITSSANRTITLNSNILDTGDIISALASASNNTTVLGAKVVADAINNLTSSINTLTKKLQNITATSGNTNVTGVLDVGELRIGNMKITYDEDSNKLVFDTVS